MRNSLHSKQRTNLEVTEEVYLETVVMIHGAGNMLNMTLSVDVFDDTP
jgi:hypothetical protein